VLLASALLGAVCASPAAAHTKALASASRYADKAPRATCRVSTKKGHGRRAKPARCVVPHAVAHAYTTVEGQVLTVAAARGALAGARGKGLRAVLARKPSSGLLVLRRNGGFTYTPTATATGAVTFYVRAVAYRKVTRRARRGKRSVAVTSLVKGLSSAAVAMSITITPPSTSASGATTQPPAFSITTTAGLDPAYNPGLADYTVACGSAGSIGIQAAVPDGETLAINGGPPMSGTINEAVPLRANQAFTFTLTTATGATTDDVRCTPADFPTWSVQRTGTPQVQWIAFTPPGGSPLVGGGLYAVIADNYGVPVWWMRASKGSSLLNASVLPDGNVAWWEPNGAGDGQIGTYSINTLAGTSPLASGRPDIVTSVDDGRGEAGANLHDFELLSNGNYLLIATAPTTGVNLTPYGVSNTNGTVINAIIQEVTPAGQLVWSWDTADHIALSETDWNWTSRGITTSWNGATAYDVIHMNSIQLLDNGSCLDTIPQSCDIVFSARHLDAVYSINMATGAINWKLGGTLVAGESLAFVGDPDANFSGQHFARILPDGTLTVHDNGSLLGRPPRAVDYHLDIPNMTATFLGQVVDPREGPSNCCGSASLLPGGDWLAAWGGSNIVTELTPAGNPVLTLTFPTGSTYRAYPVDDSSLINRDMLIAGMNAQFAASQ
jgi:hypothetical protein